MIYINQTHNVEKINGADFGSYPDVYLVTTTDVSREYVIVKELDSAKEAIKWADYYDRIEAKTDWLADREMFRDEAMKYDNEIEELSSDGPYINEKEAYDIMHKFLGEGICSWVVIYNG